MLKINKSHSLIVALKHELIRAKEAAKHWEVLAMTDDLTGLYNRRMLYELDQKLAERRDSKIEREVTLLFIDLDNFGRLNKEYGDDVGDEALRLVGETIRQNIREGDIAIRKGGDEFVIILVGCTLDLSKGSVLNRLHMMLNGGLHLTKSNTNIPIRGSMGVFNYNEDATPFENLKQADILMRDQKKSRKNNAIRTLSSSGEEGAFV